MLGLTKGFLRMEGFGKLSSSVETQPVGYTSASIISFINNGARIKTYLKTITRSLDKSGRRCRKQGTA
jgi:hypothetical protein